MPPLAIMGAMLATGIGSTIMGIKQANAQDKAQNEALVAQKTAQEQAKADKVADIRRSDTVLNKAEAKTPDIAAIMARSAQAGKAGLAGTMLTGPTGVDTSTLKLGKQTLLGS